mmetsp:Transcript_27347/g.56225  ORF Transcript_27347/g.56225 Transcript_27347/m.56225 type:complete len:80 (-) Transcript_27347:760-999(-)
MIKYCSKETTVKIGQCHKINQSTPQNNNNSHMSYCVWLPLLCAKKKSLLSSLINTVFVLSKRRSERETCHHRLQVYCLS